VQTGSLLQTFRNNISVPSSWTALTLEDGADRLSRNVGNYQYKLRKIAEKRRSQINNGLERMWREAVDGYCYVEWKSEKTTEVVVSSGYILYCVVGTSCTVL